MCLGIGTPKTINFPFVPNGKLMVSGVPVFKHMKGIYCWHFTNYSFPLDTLHLSCLQLEEVRHRYYFSCVSHMSVTP